MLIHLLFWKGGCLRNVYLRKRNRDKRLRCAKFHRKWTENQWQQVLWSDESCPDPSKEELWNVLQETWRTIPKDYLKKWQKSLSKWVHTFNLVRNSVFASCSIFPFMFASCHTYFQFSWQHIKKCGVAFETSLLRGCMMSWPQLNHQAHLR